MEAKGCVKEICLGTILLVILYVLFNASCKNYALFLHMY